MIDEQLLRSIVDAWRGYERRLQTMPSDNRHHRYERFLARVAAAQCLELLRYELDKADNWIPRHRKLSIDEIEERLEVGES